jgi:hypothetical protein
VEDREVVMKTTRTEPLTPAAALPDPKEPVMVRMLKGVLWNNGGSNTPLSKGGVYQVPRATAGAWVLIEWAEPLEVLFLAAELTTYITSALSDLEGERAGRGVDAWYAMPTTARRLERMLALTEPVTPLNGGEAA